MSRQHKFDIKIEVYDDGKPVIVKRFVTMSRNELLSTFQRSTVDIDKYLKWINF